MDQQQPSVSQRSVQLQNETLKRANEILTQENTALSRENAKLRDMYSELKRMHNELKRSFDEVVGASVLQTTKRLLERANSEPLQDAVDGDNVSEPEHSERLAEDGCTSEYCTVIGVFVTSIKQTSAGL